MCALTTFGQVSPPSPGTQDPNNPAQAQPAPPANNQPRDTRQNPAGQTDGTKPKQNDSAAQNGDQNEQTQNAGPEIVDDPNATPEEKASAEYSGPAVLSRGISASSPMNPKNTRFTPSIGFEFTENSGLTGVATQPNGKLSNDLSSGILLNYTLTGTKVYKKDTFSLMFGGSLIHYFQYSSFDSASNQLALTWQHKLSRHFSFGIRETLQEYNNNSLLIGGSQLINSGLGTTLVTSSPTTEVFDGRVLTMLSEGNVTWQMTNRLSINLSGGGFFTRRASTSLYGDAGYQAGADLAYRITRQTTLGTYYSYTHFDFIGVYGGSDINTVGLVYSVAFNPNTQLITRLGGSRLETTGLTSVALSPVLAVLLGTPGTIEAVYLKNYTPDISAQLRRKISDLSLSLSYTRGVTPGNGVILTSVQQNIIFGVNYKIGRRWNIAASAGYNSLSGYGTTGQKYSSPFVEASVYRTLLRGLDWHTRIYATRYTFDNTGFLRNTYMISTGFVWSPGDILERVW